MQTYTKNETVFIASYVASYGNDLCNAAHTHDENYTMLCATYYLHYAATLFENIANNEKITENMLQNAFAGEFEEEIAESFVFYANKHSMLYLIEKLALFNSVTVQSILEIENA